MGHAPVGHAPVGHGSMGHGSMGHDMDMDMEGPAGIPLAHGGEDRDGLEMDVLRVALGPVLPAWPADLILRCTLHGDVIASAEAELVPLEIQPTPASPDERSALLVDAAARVMLLAGWEPVATELHRVRDDLLAPSSDRGPAARRLSRVRRRIRRSRTLRWALRGMSPSAGSVPAPRADVHTLLLAQLDHAADLVDGSRQEQPGELPAMSGADLASAVEGKDLAAARLIVASLTPWGSVRGPSEPTVGATGG